MSTLLGLVVLAAAPLLAQPPYFPNLRIDTGRAPRWAAGADLDQDGDLDVVAANPGTADVTTVLGDGAGGLAVAGQFPCGAGPLGTVLADFNGDGKVDAAVPCKSAQAVALLLGNGAGGLGAPSMTPVGLAMDAYDGADVDLDGDVDIVLGSANSLITLLSTGTGAFTKKTTTVTAGVNVIALADASGDGKPDVLCLKNDFELRLSSYSGNGAGGFALTATVPLTGNHATSIVDDDFDDDGDVDVAIAFDPFPTGLSGIAVVANDGQGGFTATNYHSTGIYGVRQLSTGDLDDDGALDLIAHGMQVTWLRGSGVATFTLAHLIPAAGAGFVSDFDSDGRNDLLTAMDGAAPSIGILSKDALGRFPATNQSAAFGNVGTDVSDFDSDGDIDVLQYFGNAPNFTVTRNDGFANFTEQPAIAVPLPQNSSALRGPRIGDFDADGNDDVLIWDGGSGSSIVVGLGDGGGGVAAWQTTPFVSDGFQWTLLGEVGDFNQDGSLDLAVGRQNGNSVTSAGYATLEVRPGSGTGTFLAPVGATPFGQPPQYALLRPFVVADMDLDGRDDIVFGEATHFTPSSAFFVSIVRGTGFFWFGPKFTIPAGVGTASRVAAGDLDHDGSPDLAVVRAGPIPDVLVLRGDGSGGATIAATLGGAGIVDVGSDVAIADFDSDLFGDILVSHPAGRLVTVFPNTASFPIAFAPPSVSMVGWAASTAIPADLDGDGRLDVTGRSAFALLQPPPAAICPGGFVEYDTGCHGESWFVPRLEGFGCPTPGGLITIRLTKAPAPPLGSVALLFGGVQSAPLSLGYGCSLLVFPIVVGPIAVPLSGNGPGGGGFSIFTELPVSSLTGVSLALQAFAPHATVASGYSNSNGLRIDVQ